MNAITDQLMKEAVGQGLWAVLFVSLFLYQLKEGRRREDEANMREGKLMDFINGISNQFEALSKQYEHLSSDITEIKQELRK